jgi:hypothetical protein
MVQVVCRFQANELFDRLPSAYLVDPIALHPPCARDRLQQSQVALAQAPERPLPKDSHLAARNPSAPPMPPHPTTLRPRPDSRARFAIATPSPAPRPPSALRSRRLTTFQVQGAGSNPRARHRADAVQAAMGWLVGHRGAPHRQDSLGLDFGMLRTSLPLSSKRWWFRLLILTDVKRRDCSKTPSLKIDENKIASGSFRIDFLGSPRHFLFPKFWLIGMKSEFFNSHAILQQPSLAASGSDPVPL